MDSQALAETLRRRKKDRKTSTSTMSASTSTKNEVVVVVQLDDEHDIAPKARKTKFLAPPNKGGPSYTVTVPNAEERIREHTLPRMMWDGLELLFQVLTLRLTFALLTLNIDCSY